MQTDVYQPHVPTQTFIYIDKPMVFLTTFWESLEAAWKSYSHPPGQIFLGADPTFNIVVPRTLTENTRLTRLLLSKLRKGCIKKHGTLTEARLEWDPLTPAHLRHLESNMPTSLADNTALATPRPRIFTTVAYFTHEEACAIGFPPQRRA